MEVKAGKAMVLGGRERERELCWLCWLCRDGERWDILFVAKEGTRSLGRGRSRGRRCVSAVEGGCGGEVEVCSSSMLGGRRVDTVDTRRV